MMLRERVKLAMERLKMSQAELAKRAGVSPAAIQQILNGKTKRTRALPEIAEALGVSEEWLSGKSATSSRLFVSKFSDEEYNAFPIPYFKPTANPIFPTEPNTLAAVFVASIDWLESIAIGGNLSKLMMVRVGDSKMSPTLQQGDDILAQFGETYDGDPDGIWVINHQSAWLVRRVRRLTQGGYMLSADNPAYPSIEVADADVQIVAKVLWQGRRLTP